MKVNSSRNTRPILSLDPNNILIFSHGCHSPARLNYRDLLFLQNPQNGREKKIKGQFAGGEDLTEFFPLLNPH